MRGRLGVCAAVLLFTATVNADDGIKDFSEAMAAASRGSATPLQMPDGSQLWRYAGKAPKGDAGETLLTDRIAQSLALVHWCPTGWEETKRYPAAGMLVVEGRCK